MIEPLDAVPFKAQSSVAPPTFSLQPFVPSVREITVKLAVRPVVTVNVVV